MPGRLLDVLNRVVSRSEPADKEPKQPDESSNNNDNKKKVSFSKKVNFKPFRPRNKKSRTVPRDGNQVVARLQSGTTNHSTSFGAASNASTSSRKNDKNEGGTSGRSVNAGGEFWFNVHRRTATSPSSSIGNVAATSGTDNTSTANLSASRPSISSIASEAYSAPYSPTRDRKGHATYLATASLPTAAKRATRAKRAARATAESSTINSKDMNNQMASSATYAYDVDPSLHDSQKPSQVPRVKRNLVRDIVDKFNEEAKKRGSTENLLCDSPPARTTPPGIIEATPENAPNYALPFSYTMLGGATTSPTATPPLIQQHGSRNGEYDSKTNTSTNNNNEVIYAQVQVLNGQHNGQHNGVHKTTVHTSVPRHHQSAETPPMPVKIGSSAARKLFSKSTGSLHHLDDNDEQHLLNYQRKNKETDHSYYKFDQVDDHGDYSNGRDFEDGHKQNGKAVSKQNGHNGTPTNNSDNNYHQLSNPLPLRGGGRHTDSEGEDRVTFQQTPTTRHHVIQLHDPGRVGLRSPVGGNTSRNVEKWSENEVGPNSKKYTEHEYIHEVSVSNDAEPLIPPPLVPSSIIRDPMLPLLSGSSLAADMSLKEKFNLLMRGEDHRPLEHGVLTRSLSENKEDKSSSREWSSSYNNAGERGSAANTNGRHHHQFSVKENETLRSNANHNQKSRKQTTNSLHRSKSRDYDIDDDKQEESIIWPPPRKTTTPTERRRDTSELFLPDLKPTYYFGQPANDQTSTISSNQRQERQVLRESSEQRHQRHHSTERNGRMDKSKLEFRSTPLATRLGTRRNSNDSTGSGVGLLSSKLVKKANAEVNGYDLHHGDNLNFRASHHHMNTAFDDDDHHLRDFRFDSGERGHLGSTSRLNTTIRDLDIHRASSPLQPSPIGSRNADYNTERKRIYRREETNRTTRQHTRSNSNPRSDSDLIDRRRHGSGGGSSSPGRNPALKQRHNSSERSDNRSLEREQKRHQQQQQLRATTTTRNEEDGTEAYWNENTRHHTEQSHHREQRHKKSTDVRDTTTTTRRHRHGGRSSRTVQDELQDDKMETSESEKLYGGSQDSHMSLGSRHSSTDDELAEEGERRQRTENIIAAHVNTPESLVKQMNKKQISYENSQQHSRHHHEEERTSTPTGRRLWFERVAADEVDGLERLDGNRNPRYSTHNDNSRWTGGSATMSRLETSKNRRNNMVGSRGGSSTVDRRDTRRRRNDDVRILLNDRDIATLNGNGHVSGGQAVGRSSSFNSRVGSYHSENESQHSFGSNTSNGRPKRVNFKASAKSSNGGSALNNNSGFRYSSAADLSPIHREALLRSTSPARAPSTTGSLRSNESDGSHASSRSVILHATAVADIPPARQYCARSAATSPAPSPSSEGGGNTRESRTVQRSFSLLSPWKSPRKYSKEKRLDSSESSGILKQQNGSSRHHEAQQKQLARQHRKQQDGESLSHNSSSERLDSLSPLQSEGPAPVKTTAKSKKKSGILRRHSMPKDSRFANFFRRKKEAKTKEH